jgi:hypothetical protein
MIISISIDVDATLFYGLILAIIALIFYVCFDVHYFLTNIFLVTWCKIRRKRVKIDETTEYYGEFSTFFFHNPSKNSRWKKIFYTYGVFLWSVKI